MPDFSENANWRDTARPARFLMLDARVTPVIMLFLLHITWWTFFTMVAVLLFFTGIERYGFSVVTFFRFLRSWIAGKRRISRNLWVY